MTGSPICEGCADAIRRLLSAMSDEVATRTDPALKGDVTNLGWNVEIMSDAIAHLRTHDTKAWACSQRATWNLLREVLHA